MTISRQRNETADVSGRQAAALQLEGFLPYRLNVLAATVSEALARVYRERFGFGIPEWRVLATLGQFGECTAREISAHGMMHKTKVSRAVAALESRGLIERRENAADKREAILRLRPEGRRIYRDLVPRALAFTAELEAVLSAADRHALDAVLLKLTTRAQSMDATQSRQGED